MAQININTTPEEQQAVIQVLRALQGTTISMTTIAKKAKLNPNRVRYIIVDLVDAGKVLKVPTKAFNEHYIRYKYVVKT